jgi:hypothetical protein
MITKAWARNHQILLRRALSWPLLWKFAVNLIQEHVSHVDAGDCLLCAAKQRSVKNAHRLMMGGDRQMFCRRCGLPLRVSMFQPICTGKRPPVKPTPQPLFMHIPID